MAQNPIYVVRDWKTLYENNRSRDIGQTRWFPVPNDLSAYAYVELVALQDGAARFGVWNALLMVASKATPRGYLIREDLRPHTTESLAHVTRLPKELISATIEQLINLELLLVEGYKPSKLKRLRSQLGAVKSQEGAAEPQGGAAEGKGIEHHHQEGKRTKKKGKTEKGTRTELQGTEGGRAEYSKGSSGIEYASPEDELKAIYEAKTGESISIAVLDAIRLNLELAAVPSSKFVEEIRKHAGNKWINPAGFLLDLSKKFRAKTRIAAASVTASEAAVRDYQCSICHSRVPGEGAIRRDGVSVPCECASPEYVAHQRARGIFPPEAEA